MIKKIAVCILCLLIGIEIANAREHKAHHDGYRLVSQAALRYGIPQWLAHAVIHTESGHKCSVRNRSGASGIGQLMPGTARALGVTNTMNCAQNADAAIRYLSRFFHQSGGNACVSASAYNRGFLSGCTSYGKKIISKSRIH